ncbi:hypothetical protein KR074_003642 [Drosophila pseudoananassae]|nr:hypothetical protein KR074_003642 [Drosophila pseudoananassae]
MQTLSVVFSFIASCWRKLYYGFSHIMVLTENSRLVKCLVSCVISIVFILHLKSGSMIIQDVMKMVANARYRAKPGHQPSPIHIVGPKVYRRRLQLPLRWRHYDVMPEAVLLRNNGSTVILNISAPYNEPRPKISGGELGGRYKFLEASFKWGLHRSEHSIDSHTFSLEMQALHRCRKQTGPLEYLTISYLFMITPFANGPLQQISDHLCSIKCPESTIELPPFDLQRLMQPFTGGYYTYQGTYDNGEISLPTIWIVNSQIFGVSSQQLAQFRSLCRHDCSRITTNARQVQPVGSRCIQYHP